MLVSCACHAWAQVRVRDNLLVNGATVLPQKEIYETIRSKQIVI